MSQVSSATNTGAASGNTVTGNDFDTLNDLDLDAFPGQALGHRQGTGDHDRHGYDRGVAPLADHRRPRAAAAQKLTRNI